MNTYEINFILSDLKCFKGTYASDKLPLIKFTQRPIAFVMNTQKHTEKGEHWVALYINENNIAEYMDSFGFEPICCRIKKFCSLNGIDKILVNKNWLQFILSDTCGKYCALFIRMRCKGFTFQQFINLFSKNSWKNEFLIEYLVKV